MGSIKPLQPLPKKTMGWKVRRLEILIIETLGRATRPNTCWDIYQKIKCKNSAGGNEIGIRMQSLARRGRIKITGHDDIGDCLYIIRSEDNG